MDKNGQIVTLSKTKKSSNNGVLSQKYLRPEARGKYQTAQSVYNALDTAESQVLELLKEVARLSKENKRLSMSHTGLATQQKKRYKL